MRSPRSPNSTKYFCFSAQRAIHKYDSRSAFTSSSLGFAIEKASRATGPISAAQSRSGAFAFVSSADQTAVASACVGSLRFGSFGCSLPVDGGGAVGASLGEFPASGAASSANETEALSTRAKTSFLIPAFLDAIQPARETGVAGASTNASGAGQGT